MVLERHSRIVRWAYLHDKDVPERTSLCAIFWRSVLWTPLGLFCKVAITIWTIGWLMWLAFLAFDWAITNWPTTLRILTVVFLGAVLVVGCVVATRITSWLRTQERPIRAIKESPIYQGAVAVKSKVCPLVEIRRDW